MSSSIPADTAAASDKTELKKLRDENQELKREVNRVEANFKDFEERLSKRETELGDVRDKNSELTAEIDRLKKKGKVAEQTLQASQDNGAKQRKELKEAKRNFEEAIKARDQQLKEAKLELEESNRNNEKLRKDHEKQVFDQREELKKVHEELHNTKVILQDLEGPKGVHSQAVKQLFDTQRKLDIVTRDFQESEDVIDGLTRQIAEYENKYCKLTQEINTINAWVMDNRALLTRSEAIPPPPANNLEAELEGQLDYDSDSNYDSESGSLSMSESDERGDGGSSSRQEPEETVDRSSPTSTEPEEPADDDSSAIDESKEHIDHSSPPTSEFEPRINVAPHVTSPSFLSSDKDQQQTESSVTAADNEDTHVGHKATDVTDVTTSKTPSTKRNTTSDEQQTASVEQAGTVQNAAPIEQSTAPVETAGTVQNAATEQPATSVKEAGTTTSVEEGVAVQNITSPSGTSVVEQNITSDKQPTTSSETSATGTTAAETATANSTAAKQSVTSTEGTTSPEITAGEQDTTSTEQPTTSTAPQPAVSEHMDAATKQHVATSGTSHGGTAQATIATDHVGTANNASVRDVTTAPGDIHMEGKQPRGIVHHLLTKPQEYELTSSPKNKYEQAFKFVDPPDNQPDFRMNRWEPMCDGNVSLVHDVYDDIPEHVKLMWAKPAGDHIDPKAEVTIDSIKRYYPESGPFSALEAIQMFPAERKMRNQLAQEKRELQKELDDTIQDKMGLEDDVQFAEKDTRLAEEKLEKALKEKKDLEEDKKELEEELHDTIVQLQFTQDDVQDFEREKEKSGLPSLVDKYKQMSDLYATTKQQLEALQATASTPPSANRESELCRLTTRNAQLEASLAELKTYIAERNAHNKLVQGPTVETTPAPTPAPAPAPVVEPAPHAAEPAAPVVAPAVVQQQQQQPCGRPHLFLWPFLIFVFVFVTFCRFAASAQQERDLWLDANDGARLETLRLVHAPLGSAAAALDHRTAMLTMYGETRHEMLDLRPWWWTEGEQVRRGFWIVLRNLMGAR